MLPFAKLLETLVTPFYLLFFFSSPDLQMWEDPVGCGCGSVALVLTSFLFHLLLSDAIRRARKIVFRNAGP